MKIAKILLTGICLFSIAAGVFAYKATKLRQPLFSSNAAGLCTVPTSLFYTTQAQFPGQPIATITNSIYTTPVLGPCPTTTWYTLG